MPPATELPQQAHEPPIWMLVPSAILVLLCLLIGIMPQTFIGPVLASAAHAILGTSLPAYSLAIWHGFNLPLIMSFIAMFGGILLALILRPRQRRAPGEIQMALSELVQNEARFKQAQLNYDNLILKIEDQLEAFSSN